MDVIFLRHASAEPAGSKPDFDRDLTDTGREEARASARGLLELAGRVELVLTSPLNRAQQTGAILAKTHGADRIEPAECLAPPVNLKALMARLGAELDAGTGTVACVGHTPTLGGMVSEIVTRCDIGGITVSKAGAACVRLKRGESGIESKLRWMLHRNQLARFAGK